MLALKHHPKYFRPCIDSLTDRCYFNLVNKGASIKQLKQLMVKTNTNVVKENFFTLELRNKLEVLNPAFYASQQTFFYSLILEYVYARLTKNPNEMLYFRFINTCFYTANVYQQYEETVEIISGIYLILNVENQMCYIGKSWNILLRFEQHIEQLVEGAHFNDYLQEDFILYNAQAAEEVVSIGASNQFTTYYYYSPFLLLILEAGLVSDVERTFKEKEYIQTWPGLLYNKQYNTNN